MIHVPKSSARSHHYSEHPSLGPISVPIPSPASEYFASNREFDSHEGSSVRGAPIFSKCVQRLVRKSYFCFVLVSVASDRAHVPTNALTTLPDVRALPVLSSL